MEGMKEAHHGKKPNQKVKPYVVLQYLLIVHDKSDEVQTQVRGRYDGDLAEFYFHDGYKAVYEECPPVPNEFIGVSLYQEQQEALCKHLNLRNPKRASDDYYGWRKVVEVLRVNGYKVESGRSGALRYWTIAPKCTNSAKV